MDPMREPQVQDIPARRYGENAQQFTRCQFVGHLSRGLKFTTTGDLIVEFVVPSQYTDLALPLQHTVRGVPLSVDIEVFRPYTEARGDD